MSAADHDKAGGAYEDFEAKYGAEVANAVLQDICEAAYGERSGKTHHASLYSFTIDTIHQHDAINMTFDGHVAMPDGTEYAFVIDDGNWNGTVVREWGDPAHVQPYEPPKPDPYRLIPKNRDVLRAHRPGLWKAYLHWRGEPWFTELERAYNYDRHFAPGSVTSNHYTGPNSLAAKRGLVWMRESDVNEFINRPQEAFDLIPSPEAVAAFAQAATREAFPPK